MKKDVSIVESVVKFGLAVAAVFYPGASLVEPAIDVITNVFKSRQPLSKIETKILEELELDLKKCVRITIESMKSEATTETSRRAIGYLQPYIENRLSNTTTKNLTSKDFEQIISEFLSKKEVYYEIYAARKDIELLQELFYAKFNISLIAFPNLYSHINRLDIDAIKNALAELWKVVEELNNQDSGNITREELKDTLRLAFENERAKNPSVENICFSKELLPCGKANEYSITAKINKERINVPIADFFDETWNSAQQNHISITGIGGIGKTVALFNLKYPAPTIYIPLRDLATSAIDYDQEYITKYIKQNTLSSFDNSFDVLLHMCNEPWKSGPNIILILDGLNEITSSKLTHVLHEIRKKWAKKQGIQLVFTSRYDINAKLQIINVNQVLIEPLSTSIISKYLKDANIKIPNDADRLWRIIDTPLMLMLYCRSELIRLSHKSEFANWRAAENGGSIIWNYLQSELCKADFDNKLEGIVAILFFAPFICYKMMSNRLFSISKRTFKKYISETMLFYNNLKDHNILPSIIEKAIDENDDAEIDERHFYSLLTKNFSVFRLRGDAIQLVHQHFRDCLAAIHIIQVVDNASELPNEWKTNFDLHVLDFICDLLSTEQKTYNDIGTWDKIWGFAYQKENNTSDFINKMLHIYKKVYGNDISKIDFSNVDLKQISLNSFKLTGNSKNHFINSKLGRDTFWGNGHSDTVSSASWGMNDKYYISASHDCTIRIHNEDNSVSEILEGAHEHYIRCAKCSPTDENVIASAGDDQQVICWTKLGSNKTNMKWIPRILGECSNWIRSLQWDKKGQRILCGDGGGNLRMFTHSNLIDFEHKHSKNVRYLAWLETENKTAIASGSDDGTFCIWRDNGSCVFYKPLDGPITSVNWIQSGMYLVVSTSKRVYFYKINHLMQDDNFDTQIQLVKDLEGYDISCIASSNTNEMDYVAIFDNNSLKIFSLFNIDGELQIDELGNCQYDGETNRIITAEWNHLCNKLICGSRDGSVSRIDILSDEENNQRIIFDIVGKRCCKAARCSSWSPNGQWLAVGYDDCSIRVWDPLKERCLAVLKAHTDSVKSLSWCPDGLSLVSGSDDKKVKIWKGSSITHFTPRTVCEHEESVNAVLWLKNNTIVSAGDDGSLYFIYPDNLEKNNKITQHSQRVYSLAASPNEDFIISGGNDNYILLWDINAFSCHKYGSGHQLPIRSVAWSNDGNFVISSSNDCTINLRNFDSEKMTVHDQVSYLPKMHQDFIYGANITKNDLYIVGGSTDSTVGFWSAASKEFLHKSTAHKGFVWNVSSSPRIADKYYIATSSSDGTVKIWDVSDHGLDAIEPCFNLPVIPEIDIVGCDFTGAIIEDSTLRNLIIANGGVFNQQNT